MMLGSYDNIIAAASEIYTGFIQVQDTGFWDSRSLENSMALDEGRLEQAKKIDKVTSIVPRIESFALGSVDGKTEGVTVAGTDPDAEEAMNGLGRRIVSGKYFTSSSEGVLIGSELARRLGDVAVGDSIVLLSQGFYGSSAVGLYAIEGIVKLPLPDLDNSILYMPLTLAQTFFNMEGRVTSLVVMTKTAEEASAAAGKLSEIFPAAKGYAVLTWKELLPELVQGTQFHNIVTLIVLGILYVVAGFGVFGTVMMMTNERRKEFSMMISIGMKPRQLSIMVFAETVVMAMMGALCGVAAAIPLLLYMHANPIQLRGVIAEATIEYGFEPILPFIVNPALFVNHGLTIFIIAVLVSIYPLWSVNRIHVSQELRA